MTVANLAKLAAADRQPALALTDTNNLFGALEFSEKLAGMGIQPIAGLQLSVAFEEPDPTARTTAAPVTNVVLLAQNQEGYRNLLRLVSHAHFDDPLGDAPQIAAPLLSAHREGLIALTGGPTGPLDLALRAGGRQDLARSRVEATEAGFRRQPLRRNPASWARRRALDRGRADRARRPQRSAHRRDERALLRQVRATTRRTMRFSPSRMAGSSPTRTAAGCRPSMISRRGGR